MTSGTSVRLHPSPSLITFWVQGETPNGTTVSAIQIAAITVQDGLDTFQQSNTQVTNNTTTMTASINCRVSIDSDHLAVALAMIGSTSTSTYGTIQVHDGAAFGHLPGIGDTSAQSRVPYGVVIRRTLTADQVVRIRCMRNSSTGPVSLYQQRLMLIHLSSWLTCATSHNPNTAGLTGSPC